MAKVLHSGAKAVADAATPEKLAATSIPVLFVEVQARKNNTQPVAVGGSEVDVVAGKGIVLAAGERCRFYEPDVDELGDIWVDVTVNAEGVGYSYSQDH